MTSSRSRSATGESPVPGRTSMRVSASAGGARNSEKAAHEATTIAGSPLASAVSARALSMRMPGSSLASSYGSCSRSGSRATPMPVTNSASSSLSACDRADVAVRTTVGPSLSAAMAAAIAGFAASGAPIRRSCRPPARVPDSVPASSRVTPANSAAKRPSNTNRPIRALAGGLTSTVHPQAFRASRGITASLHVIHARCPAA